MPETIPGPPFNTPRPLLLRPDPLGRCQTARITLWAGILAVTFGACHVGRFGPAACAPPTFAPPNKKLWKPPNSGIGIQRERPVGQQAKVVCPTCWTCSAPCDWHDCSSNGYRRNLRISPRDSHRGWKRMKAPRRGKTKLGNDLGFERDEVGRCKIVCNYTYGYCV